MAIQPVTEITWNAGQQASNPVFLRGEGFNRILVPAGFEGATLTFQCAVGNGGAAPAGTAFRTMRDAGGTVLSAAVDPAFAVAIAPDMVAGAGWFRFMAASVQAAARTVQLLHPVR